jgi:hypothetical protein
MMQRKTAKSEVLAVIGHLSMGMALGALLAMAVLLDDRARILQMFLDGPSPAAAIAVFVGIFATVTGVGATLTGLVFQSMQED